MWVLVSVVEVVTDVVELKDPDNGGNPKSTCSQSFCKGWTLDLINLGYVC